MQASEAVTHEKDVINDNRGRPKMKAEALDVPKIFAGLLVDGPELATFAAEDHCTVVQGGRTPDTGVGPLVLLHRPHECVLAVLGGVELEELAEFLRSSVSAFKLGCHVEHAFGIDNDRSIDIVPNPIAERADWVAAVAKRSQIPTLNQSAGVCEVQRVATDRDGVLNRDVVVGDR